MAIYIFDPTFNADVRSIGDATDVLWNDDLMRADRRAHPSVIRIHSARDFLQRSQHPLASCLSVHPAMDSRYTIAWLNLGPI